MAADSRDILIADMADLLATRFTKAGHLALITPWEHRGGCPVSGCGPGCLEARSVLRRAVEHLESVAASVVQ